MVYFIKKTLYRFSVIYLAVLGVARILKSWIETEISSDVALDENLGWNWDKFLTD